MRRINKSFPRRHENPLNCFTRVRSMTAGHQASSTDTSPQPVVVVGGGGFFASKLCALLLFELQLDPAKFYVLLADCNVQNSSSWVQRIYHEALKLHPEFDLRNASISSKYPSIIVEPSLPEETRRVLQTYKNLDHLSDQVHQSRVGTAAQQQPRGSSTATATEIENSYGDADSLLPIEQREAAKKHAGIRRQVQESITDWLRSGLPGGPPALIINATGNATWSPAYAAAAARAGAHYVSLTPDPEVMRQECAAFNGVLQDYCDIPGRFDLELEKRAIDGSYYFPRAFSGASTYPTLSSAMVERALRDLRGHSSSLESYEIDLYLCPAMKVSRRVGAATFDQIWSQLGKRFTHWEDYHDEERVYWTCPRDLRVPFPQSTSSPPLPSIQDTFGKQEHGTAEVVHWGYPNSRDGSFRWLSRRVFEIAGPDSALVRHAFQLARRAEDATSRCYSVRSSVGLESDALSSALHRISVSLIPRQEVSRHFMLKRILSQRRETFTNWFWRVGVGNRLARFFGPSAGSLLGSSAREGFFAVCLTNREFPFDGSSVVLRATNGTGEWCPVIPTVAICRDLLCSSKSNVSQCHDLALSPPVPFATIPLRKQVPGNPASRYTTPHAPTLDNILSTVANSPFLHSGLSIYQANCIMHTILGEQKWEKLHPVVQLFHSAQASKFRSSVRFIGALQASSQPRWYLRTILWWYGLPYNLPSAQTNLTVETFATPFESTWVRHYPLRRKNYTQEPPQAQFSSHFTIDRRAAQVRWVTKQGGGESAPSSSSTKLVEKFLLSETLDNIFHFKFDMELFDEESENLEEVLGFNVLTAHLHRTGAPLFQLGGKRKSPPSRTLEQRAAAGSSREPTEGKSFSEPTVSLPITPRSKYGLRYRLVDVWFLNRFKLPKWLTPSIVAIERGRGTVPNLQQQQQQQQEKRRSPLPPNEPIPPVSSSASQTKKDENNFGEVSPLSTPSKQDILPTGDAKAPTPSPLQSTSPPEVSTSLQAWLLVDVRVKLPYLGDLVSYSCSLDISATKATHKLQPDN